MAETLRRHDGDLVPGTVVERPNRFVLHVRFAEHEQPERVYLSNPGALRVLQPGSEVLCDPADDPERTTDWDAIAVRDARSACWVSLRSALANDLLVAALDAGLLPEFPDYDDLVREPQLPDHGRADVRLDHEGAAVAYVEVKSCTHVEDGTAKFPDRQTARGRRHLRSLRDLATAGTDAHVVFVVQRPDAEELRPFREVDPDFADLLQEAAEAGVGIHAMTVEFDPPNYVLVNPDLPVVLE